MRSQGPGTRPSLHGLLIRLLLFSWPFIRSLNRDIQRCWQWKRHYWLISHHCWPSYGNWGLRYLSNPVGLFLLWLVSPMWLLVEQVCHCTQCQSWKGTSWRSLRRWKMVTVWPLGQSKSWEAENSLCDTKHMAHAIGLSMVGLVVTACYLWLRIKPSCKMPARFSDILLGPGGFDRTSFWASRISLGWDYDSQDGSLAGPPLTSLKRPATDFVSEPFLLGFTSQSS